MGVGEYMQLNVEFKPMKVGDYKGTLTVHYNTGKQTQDVMCDVDVLQVRMCVLSCMVDHVMPMSEWTKVL